MKTRLSLVSNSSSASFMVLWRALPDSNGNTPDNVKDAVRKLFGYTKDDDWQTDKNIEDIINNTKFLKSDIYETRYWTSMYNDITDLPPGAAYIMFALAENSAGEIIKHEVIGDY